MEFGYLLCVTTLFLAGCSSEPSAEERAAKEREDAAAIAAVEAAQVPPVEPVQPQPITFEDVEREDLFGAGCDFAMQAGDGRREPIVIAQGEAGYLKLEDRIQRFAPDAGSGQLPYNAREQYVSTSRTFRLSVDQEEGRRTGPETTDYPGELVVRDQRDRLVYQAKGSVQCGA